MSGEIFRDGRLCRRWTDDQKHKAWAIVNDIAEDIDGGETRAELRQALSIYADMLYDALQDRACKKTEKLMEAVEKLAAIMTTPPASPTTPDTSSPNPSKPIQD